MIRYPATITPYNHGNTKCFLACSGIFHGTHLARWDWPEICKLYWRDFICVDYNPHHLIIEDHRNSIYRFIEDQKYEKVIICGLSFGEIIARDIITHIPKTLKWNLLHHISLCGVSTYQALSSEKRRLVHMSEYIRSFRMSDIAKKVVRKLAHIENNGTPLWGKHMFAKKNFMNHTWLSSNRRQTIIDAWSKWFNSSIIDRWAIVFATQTIQIIDIPTTAIYARNDWFFTDAQAVAEHILEHCTTDTCLIEAYPWWHASLVELPETYNPILETILQSF